ncbi:MAG: formate dehydrogenase accessory sulfurtransferase FdhD [Candidatus Bathyarchaeota archaeon]|nr:formate dehydrogenase accessory sulfurtransferase FdhD [Candidatus Bathyarchaeum tardum]WNZ29163.1 MAG: formate dehydrogenase accessory sulfurtransferase FdhD [Candidatus Bathyarchaeota archaeon]
MREIKINRLNTKKQTIKQQTDYVAEEKALHIYLNKRHYGTILCSPNQQKEMVLGHLLGEGVLTSTDEIEKLIIKKGGILTLKPNIDATQRISLSQRFSRRIVSACGSPDYRPISEIVESIPKLEFNLKVNSKVIYQSVTNLNQVSENFKTTGGVHAAALYSKDGKLLFLAEDVGRHNAVDKVIGAGALNQVAFSQCFLALSGRLTGDLVLKAARMKIQIVASLAAAISSGLDVAEITGVTLVGFARDNRMNVYTYPERIDLTKNRPLMT